MSEDSNSGIANEVNSVPIRENLVETAVNFLLNPSVRHKPDHGKIAFLKNKGLTDPEISAAFVKVQSDPSFSTLSKQTDLQHAFNSQSTPYVSKSYSFWSKLSSISSSLIVIAVALYGLHRFYKLYIEPWLFGTKTEEDEMKRLVKDLHESVLQLKNSVSTLEGTVKSQKEQIDRVFLAEGSPYMPIPMAVAELKTDIGSIKSLLINRHQFPSVPKAVTNPSIPLWQLPASKDKEDKCNENDMTAENSKSDPQSSTVPTIQEISKNGESDAKLDNVTDLKNGSVLIKTNGINGLNSEGSDQETSDVEDKETVSCEVSH